MLTSQYEQAKITEARDTPTVQVLDPAVPADNEIKPRCILQYGCGCGRGDCGLAIVFAYMLESRARRKMSVPILTLVLEIDDISMAMVESGPCVC